MSSIFLLILTVLILYFHLRFYSSHCNSYPQNTSTDPAMDPTSMYFVHPSDGPASIAILPKLTGSTITLGINL